MTAVAPQPSAHIVYPESDGKPIADNTLQFRWIVTLQGNLDALYADDPNVFVAGDLLWYPVQGEPQTRVAPDVLVAFGRAKGDRGSYRQWEEDNIPPQVVFEVLSPGNRLGEMLRKQDFYEQFGVEEYYLYDPERFDLTVLLRRGDRLTVQETVNGFVSPRLGIRFEVEAGREMRVFHPDGAPFASFVEIAAAREAERHARVQAEQERDTERERAERLAARLRALGLDPESE